MWYLKRAEYGGVFLWSTLMEWLDSLTHVSSRAPQCNNLRMNLVQQLVLATMRKQLDTAELCLRRLGVLPVTKTLHAVNMLRVVFSG